MPHKICGKYILKLVVFYVMRAVLKSEQFLHLFPYIRKKDMEGSFRAGLQSINSKFYVNYPTKQITLLTHSCHMTEPPQSPPGALQQRVLLDETF